MHVWPPQLLVFEQMAQSRVAAIITNCVTKILIYVSLAFAKLIYKIGAIVEDCYPEESTISSLTETSPED